MATWPRYPALFEVNTWAWLSDLSQKSGKRLDLSSVPSEEWDAIAGFGFDAVWLMGVWERSPAGIAIANATPELLKEFRNTLPDFQPRDNVGSAYCIKRYVVDDHLGGPSALEIARRELAKRDVRLLLDFVPNHVAPDHAWTAEHPEYFIRGTLDDFAKNPASFKVRDANIFACGRDPHFPAWPDVLQLNAFHPGLRQAVNETIASIASQCDGVRCDMAMLTLNPIFERTWGRRAGKTPANEYWPEVMAGIRQAHPGFLFIAEAYWDLEWELQQQGFDYCYDKRLYDRLDHENAESVRLHLCADLAYQGKLVRFIENHDEPRAASIFSPAKEQAAAVTMATLPGARLFHEGQLEGRTVKLPVFLGRRPHEAANEVLRDFYAKLLKTIDQPLFREGRWRLCGRSGWPDNASFRNLVAWSWTFGEDRCLIVVNLSDHPVQARLQVPWNDLSAGTWSLNDTFSGANYTRSGDELQSAGLYVELGQWRSHFFQLKRVSQPTIARAA